MKTLDSAGLTDIGKKRKINQDSFLVNDASGLYVVADGIGGRLAGDVASKMAVEIVEKTFASQTSSPEDEKNNDGLSKKALRLLGAISEANKRVFDAARTNDALKGMGTTISAVCMTDNPSIGKTLIGANIGDSPIYLVHQGSIEMLSVPHTVTAKMPVPNSESNAPATPMIKHMLTRAVGIKNSVEADTFEIQCYTGDIVVICSDGLCNKVEREEINTIVSYFPPKEACQNLVDLANHRGGEDNITVVIVKVTAAPTKRRLGWLLGGMAQLFNSHK